jgi:hypothetical protein
MQLIDPSCDLPLPGLADKAGAAQVPWVSKKRPYGLKSSIKSPLKSYLYILL